MIEALDQTAAANQMTQDVHARLMITRGLKSKPFQDPRLSQQGLTIAIIMEHSKVPEHIYNKGITLHTVPIYRGLPVTQDPKLNSHSKLNCILACIHAQKAGADVGSTRFRQHYQLLQFLYCSQGRSVDLNG